MLLNINQLTQKVSTAYLELWVGILAGYHFFLIPFFPYWSILKEIIDIRTFYS